ncbi:MAG: hypothetical protein ACOX7N_09845 [Lawsonibacter sp.]|jgi:hypothetical protein
MTTSIPLRIYLNTIFSPAVEKPAQKKLRIWGDFVGRTTEIFNYIIPQKPATYKGFRSGGYRIATLISSQPRYDHFDTAAYKKLQQIPGEIQEEAQLSIPNNLKEIKALEEDF